MQVGSRTLRRGDAIRAGIAATAAAVLLSASGCGGGDSKKSSADAGQSQALRAAALSLQSAMDTSSRAIDGVRGTRASLERLGASLEPAIAQTGDVIGVLTPKAGTSTPESKLLNAARQQRTFLQFAADSTKSRSRSAANSALDRARDAGRRASTAYAGIARTTNALAGLLPASTTFNTGRLSDAVHHVNAQKPSKKSGSSGTTNNGNSTGGGGGGTTSCGDGTLRQLGDVLPVRSQRPRHVPEQWRRVGHRRLQPGDRHHVHHELLQRDPHRLPRRQRRSRLHPLAPAVLNAKTPSSRWQSSPRGVRWRQRQPTEEDQMNLYAILRRSGWRSGEELQEAAARSTRVGDEDMPDEVRWIRSYVLEEVDGSVGTVCIYEATSPEAIRRHASLADLPVDEIVPIADTVVVRPDPQPAEA